MKVRKGKVTIDEDFNVLVLEMDISSRQKIIKDIAELIQPPII
jgi:hypothetical protein